MSQGQYYKDKVAETIQKFDPSHLVVEIGTDSGTTAHYALQALKEANDKRWFFTIDPYGDKPYKAGMDVQGSNMGYNDKHYMSAVSGLYQYANENELNYLHWKLLSTDWMKIYPEIAFWSDGTILKPKFALAYLDGDHNWDPVFDEFVWFYNHMPSGGVIVIDDFNLLEGENEVRRRLKHYEGMWYFNYDDKHHRAYFTKL